MFLPFALGIPVHKNQQPCRNGVTPAAAGLADHHHQSQGVQPVRAGSRAPGRGAGWLRGLQPRQPCVSVPCLPTAFPSQLLRHSLNAFCPCPGLCVAFNESTFNTAAQSVEADGGADYSIFQISSQLWGTDDRSPSDNHRRMACRDSTALLPQSQPQDWRQQAEPSFSAQLHPLAKMEPWRHEGPNLGNPMPVAAGSSGW